MQIIIIGSGEVGYHIARKLSEDNDVVVIEKDSHRFKRVDEELNVQCFHGSGTSPGLLKDAGIGEAEMLIAVTDSDEVNLISCLLAKSLNPYILKVARVRNPEYIREKSLFGRDMLGVDHVINPESLMVDSIVKLLGVPEAVEIIDFADGRVRLLGLIIPPGSPFLGRRLMDIESRIGDVLVGAIARGDEMIIPRGTDMLKEGDLAYVVVKHDNVSSVLHAIGIAERPLHGVVIVGGGNAGGSLAMRLESMKFNSKIIDVDPARCAELSEALERVVVINGDATDKDLLVEENVGDVDFLIALTGDEERNILISLLARSLGAKRALTRVSKPGYFPFVSAIGISTLVSPQLCAIRAILQHLRKGKIISVSPLKGDHAEAIEAEALETSDIVNKPLNKVRFPVGAIVGAIVRREDIIIPNGDSVVLPKDRLIIFSRSEAISKLEKLLTVKLEYF